MRRQSIVPARAQHTAAAPAHRRLIARPSGSWRVRAPTPVELSRSLTIATGCPRLAESAGDLRVWACRDPSCRATPVPCTAPLRCPPPFGGL